MEARFRGDAWDLEEARGAIEKGKKEIEKSMAVLKRDNHQKCVENCELAWQEIYGQSKEFDEEDQITTYFGNMLEELK
jgi:hypothetical protein